MKRLLAVGTLVALLLGLWLGSKETPIPDSTGDALSEPYGVRLHRSAPKSFRVADFNIQRSKGKDGVRDLSRAIGVLGSADVIALQEVAGTKYYGWDDQARQIAEQLKLGYLFAPTMKKWFQPYAGNALLSKFEVSSWQVVTLPQGEGASGGYRNLIEAKMRVDGELVTLLVTHLDRGTPHDKQLQVVLDRFNAIDGPAILFGDLNTDKTDPQLVNLFKNALVNDAIDTAIGDFWRLDWIITRGFEVKGGGYTPRGISDHAHYWVDLELH